MRKLYLSLLITSALNASAAFAQADNETYLDTYPPEAAEVMPATEIPIPQDADTQSRLWLQLQESGAMAGSRYTLPGQAATLIYQRYLGSFAHPIPPEFEYGEMDGGSSSGGSSAIR